MRIVAVLLSLVLLAPAGLAVKAKKKELSVDETLKYLNDRLLVNYNWVNMRCSDRLELSLSEGRQEIILKYLPIDKHGRDIEELPPRYIYHIPIDSVTRVYPWGPRFTNDRVVVRTSGRAVEKIGPVWNCDKNRINAVPKARLLDSFDLKLDVPDDANFKGVIKGIRHLVKLLQDEQSAESGPQSNELPDEDE